MSLTGECFICMESGAFPTDCACKNLFVHNDCLKKLVYYKHTNRCGVCNSSYDNVQIVYDMKPRLNFKGIYSFLMCVTSLVFIGIGVAFSVRVPECNFCGYVFYASSLIMMLFTCIFCKYTRGSLKPCLLSFRAKSVHIVSDTRV